MKLEEALWLTSAVAVDKRHAQLTPMEREALNLLASTLDRMTTDAPKIEWMRDYELSLNRRGNVEAELFEIANGKKPIPTDKEQFRKWAHALGVPVEWLARVNKLILPKVK